MNPIRVPNAKALLLLSASVLSLTVGSNAYAGPLSEHVQSNGSQVISANPTTPIPNIPGVVTNSQQIAAQQARSTTNLATAATRLQAALTAQANARSAAQAGPNNLGADPNHPGSQLPNVSDGLAAGGLVPDSGVASTGTANPVLTWVGANTPTQSTSNGQASVNITQTQAQALLNWQTFNVGKNTTVNFVQKDSTGANQPGWVALNKVNDPSAIPSQILGQINAPGSVYILDRNGVIFGGSSQVNVHSLIAAATDLDPSLAANNYQLFLQNGLFSVPNAVLGGANLSGKTGAVFQSGNGTISVEPGAIIDIGKDVSAGEQGGYVALIGATVTNAGTINAQNGQIILAGDALSGVALVLPSASAVGTQTAISVSSGAGTVTNAADGVIQSNDGAVTLAGGVINQLGAVAVTTGVARTGSILMSAPTTGSLASITLGADSVTSILPDETSGTIPTATATSSYFTSVLQPQILIDGNLDAQGNGAGKGGALVKAPSAALTVTDTGVNTLAVLEPGSLIDLSGLAGVSVPVAENQISILVTAAEVADDPLAKSLIGQTVTIDARLSGTRADGLAWVGSPILDASGYVSLIPKTIDQILTAGGSFNAASQTFVQEQGATVDISGGFVTYQGGRINTTKLMDANGRIVDIGSADPTVLYTGIANQFTVTSLRWGVSTTYTSPLLGAGTYVPTYNQGFNAGTVSVNAVVPILEGDIDDSVVLGVRQVAQASAGDQIPKAGTLNITFARTGDKTTDNPYDVVLESEADAGADPFGLSSFSSSTAATWTPTLNDGAFPVFSDLLNQSDLSSISITGSHGFSVPADTSLTVRPGGSMTFTGVSTVDGKLIAPSGSINLTGFTYATGQQQLPPVPALVIGPNALLDVHGLWINNTGLTEDQLESAAFVNGGNVSITTLAASTGPGLGDGAFVDVTQSIILAPGSVIDLSGGGYVNYAGKFQMGSDGLPLGKGGSLTVAAYGPAGFTGVKGGEGHTADYNVAPQGTNPDGSVNTADYATIFLGGTIYSDGYDGGGTLSLEASSFTINNSASSVTADISTKLDTAIAGLPVSNFAVSDANAGQVILPSSLFTSGFSQYVLNTQLLGSAVSTTIANNTQLSLLETNFLLSGHERLMPTGSLVRDFASVGTLPEGLRKPAGLKINTNNFLLGQGADIVTDPEASVTVIADADATMMGEIDAPSGTISVLANNLTVGSTAVLDAAGTFLPNPLVTTYNTGTVLNGGTITLAANNAVMVETGAQINIEGAQVTAASNLIQLPSTIISNTPVGETEWSNGGALQLAGVNMYFAGNVNAAGGAPHATGGSLAMGSQPVPAAFAGYFFGTVLPNTINLVVEQSANIAAALANGAVPTIAGGFIGADTLSNSDFDSVTLNANTIAFAGSQTISIPGALTLNTTGAIALLPAATGLLPTGVTNLATYAPASCGAGCIPTIGGTTVNLNAGYVLISGATDFGGALPTLPKLADGTLNVNAQWIDLERGISLNNAGNVNLTSSGAIRLLPPNYDFINQSQSQYGGANGGTIYGGWLITPGNLTLSAAEIYPVSNTDYLLASTGTQAQDSTVTILQNGTPTAPLSAGGGIVISGKTIVQDGTLWAPLGSIILGLQDMSLLPTALSSYVPQAFGTALVPTQTLTLGAGSLTSVSAAGLYIPDGTTVDGITWYEGPPGANPLTGNIPTFNTSSGPVTAVLSAPPAKSISLFGADVTTEAGATLDLSGGGDIYAAEFVAGNGGSRNVLATYQTTATGFTNTYADGRQVYALVPSYEAKVAAYDTNFASYPYYSGTTPIASNGSNNSVAFPSSIAPGQSVTIGAGTDVPAGTYTLLPGMYATLPGAYRVVQVASNINPHTSAVTTADGSQYVAGVLSNAITGAHASQTALFQLQSDAVWTKYSQINITSGTAFFDQQAKAAGLNPPPLPVDGGVLTLGASNSLSLSGTNLFAPGTSELAPGITGAGGQVQISGANILILASDISEPSEDCKAGGAADCTGTVNYLVLDADQISKLAATTVLIGGSTAISNGVDVLTAEAQNLEVETDAAHPLTGPELILATTGAAASKGLTVDAGSVITAVGNVPTGTDRDITIGANPVAIVNNQGNIEGYTAGVSGDGALLRVSNGDAINITRNYVPGIYTGPGPVPVSSVPLGSFTISDNVVIDGGNALAIDTSGNGSLAATVTLKANNYDLASSLINIGGGSSGVVLNPTVLQNFAGAQSVSLHSASVIDLYDANGLVIGDAAHPIGTLTFDSAGLYSQGGTTTINATNVDLTDSQATANTAGALTASGGVLNANASGQFIFDAGDIKLANFATINVTANQAIAFTGAGATDAGAAVITLVAPELLANAGSVQSLITTGALSIAPGTNAAPAVDTTNVGGGVTIAAASITDTGLIEALAGNVGLVATAGDVVLSGNARIDAAGSAINILDVTEDAPAGNVKLVSDTGNVTLGAGTDISVAAAGNGYAGSLSILAAGNTTLNGTLEGSAAFKDLGGSFALESNSLDASSSLPVGGFSGAFTVRLGTGDITIGAGQTLASDNVLLVADSGNVIVNGTIDASNPNGGAIALYGTGGVTVGSGALLKAAYVADDPSDPAYANGTSTLMQQGGTITLGTTGTPDGSLNTTYGYENVPTSGAITVASGAVLDVSGGPGGASINNAGGEINLRAPLLSDNSVNVNFSGTVKGTTDASGNASGNGLVLNAFAVWSTTDNGGAASDTHFDGIIDPAGWFDANGVGLAGADQNGNAIANAPTPTNPLAADQVFIVTSPNTNHVDFYQTTLVNFVEGFDPANAGSLNSPPNVHLRPEIDLINPSTAINNGDITIASNWNLGAGTVDATGVELSYRTSNGKEPGTVALLAANNININATISDGFFTNYTPPSTGGDAMAQYTSEVASALYQSYSTLLDANGLPIYDASGANVGIQNYGYPDGLSTYLGYTLPLQQGPSATFFGLSQADYNALNLQFTLQRPVNITSSNPQVIDQYNQYYAQYITMFRAYESDLIVDDTQTSANAYSGSYPGGSILSYTDFVNYAVPGVSLYAVGAIPLPPTTATTYADLQHGLGAISFDGTGTASTIATDYMTQWTTYFFNIVNADLSDSNGGATTLPQAVQQVFGNSAVPTLANVPGIEMKAPAGTYAEAAVTPPAAPPDYEVLSSTYQQSVPVPPPPPPPADRIANNPGFYNDPVLGNTVVFNTTAASQLMMAAVSGKGSFSYNFVSGAAFNGNTVSVDPDAVVPSSSLSSNLTGDVTINGHTAYTDTDNLSGGTGRTLTITIPTLARTGTGAIDIAAAGDVQFLDDVRPGAIYTAGAAAATPADFTAPIPGASASNGLVSTPAWATDGGAVTVNAGGAIVGIEMPQLDTDGSQTGIPGNATGQLWSDWYYHAGVSNGTGTPFSGGGQTAAWINYATFFQGFGALGGGDIALTAGGDIVDIGASLPETIVVGGGRTIADPPKESFYGGGDLVVKAGGNLVSSDFLVGRGSGLIQVGGAVLADPNTTVENNLNEQGVAGTPIVLPLLLAVQDGFVSVQAKDSIALGNVYDPAGVPSNAQTLTNFAYLPGGSAGGGFFNVGFTSYGPDSGVSLVSFSGDIDALTVPNDDSHDGSTLFVRYDTGTALGQSVVSILAPATIDLTALGGNIAINDGPVTSNEYMVPYPTQTGDDTGNLRLVAQGSINLGAGLQMPDPDVGAAEVLGANTVQPNNYVSPLGIPLGDLTMAIHANDPTTALIAAGQNLIVSTGMLLIDKPITIEAGNNIGAAFGSVGAATGSLNFTGENNNAGDVTSIIAGNDIVGGTYSLYGPGTFIVQAGQDLGPLDAGGGLGIIALGNGSNAGAFRKYLPAQGADIDVLFGVKPGIDYAAAISDYVNPAMAGGDGINFLTDIAAQLGQSPDQAWASFQNLSGTKQDLLVDRAFLDFLTQVATDYRNPSSPYFNKYGRAYDAIATLFPASLGYTDNASGGSSDGAASRVVTGNMNLAGSLLESQMGGDINIIGPGGSMTLGHSTTDTLLPNQEGVLTLAGGSIQSYTDGSVILNQSRVMTLQGGDVDIFTANGDILAGEGPKTYVSDPSLSIVCDTTGFCFINPQGLVTGAGIGALVTLPGQDPTKSNATLVAPHGTVDAGSAGIRVAGNLNIVALQVLNAFNVNVGGQSFGLPPKPTTNLSLTAVSSASTEAANLVRQIGSQQSLVISVEVTGFGGQLDDPSVCIPTANNRCN